MRRTTREDSTLRTGVIICLAIAALSLFAPPALAQDDEPLMKQVYRSPGLGAIKHANTAAIDCSVCPRDLAKAGETAITQLHAWNRFRIVDNPAEADVLFIFSANPYLGDYVTRKGPDKRPVRIEGTIMTVIDPRTGEELWTDGRRWGSWLVGFETKALIDELRDDLEGETTRWTLDDVFSCKDTAAYKVFAALTLDAALAQPGVSRIPDRDDRLNASASDAPEFCDRVQLVIGPDNKVNGFEVAASESDTLDISDILERADAFDISNMKDPVSQKMYLIAQTRDKKMLIRFELQGRQTALSLVRYLY